MIFRILSTLDKDELQKMVDPHDRWNPMGVVMPADSHLSPFGAAPGNYNHNKWHTYDILTVSDIFADTIIANLRQHRQVIIEGDPLPKPGPLERVRLGVGEIWYKIRHITS